MDKPAERLTREKQFRVRVPIGAILLLQYQPLFILNIHVKSLIDYLCNINYSFHVLILTLPLLYTHVNSRFAQILKLTMTYSYVVLMSCDVSSTLVILYPRMYSTLVYYEYNHGFRLYRTGGSSFQRLKA